MRKSKMNSAQGHLGGVSVGEGIVPPAAAAFDRAVRPENDSILREVLSPEELSQISALRQIQMGKRSRLHTQDQQAKNDIKRQQVNEALLRDQEKHAEGALGRRRSRLGEPYKAGHTAPISEEEAAALTGEPVSPADVAAKGGLSGQTIPSVSKEEGGKSPKSPAKPKKSGRKAKKTSRKKLAPVSAEEAAGDGGTPNFSNSIGVNPSPVVPASGRRSRSKE